MHFFQFYSCRCITTSKNIYMSLLSQLRCWLGHFSITLITTQHIIKNISHHMNIMLRAEWHYSTHIVHSSLSKSKRHHIVTHGTGVWTIWVNTLWVHSANMRQMFTQTNPASCNLCTHPEKHANMLWISSSWIVLQLQ